MYKLENVTSVVEIMTCLEFSITFSVMYLSLTRFLFLKNKKTPALSWSLQEGWSKMMLQPSFLDTPSFQSILKSQTKEFWLSYARNAVSEFQNTNSLQNNLQNKRSKLLSDNKSRISRNVGRDNRDKWKEVTHERDSFNCLLQRLVSRNGHQFISALRNS